MGLGLGPIALIFVRTKKMGPNHGPVKALIIWNVLKTMVWNVGKFQWFDGFIDDISMILAILRHICRFFGKFPDFFVSPHSQPSLSIAHARSTTAHYSATHIPRAVFCTASLTALTRSTLSHFFAMDPAIRAEVKTSTTRNQHLFCKYIFNLNFLKFIIKKNSNYFILNLI